KLDSMQSTNRWNPWLGIEVAVRRRQETGHVLVPDEELSPDAVLRLYTMNNAILHHEEMDKGTLERRKLYDMILIDCDHLTCTAVGPGYNRHGHPTCPTSVPRRRCESLRLS